MSAASNSSPRALLLDMGNVLVRFSHQKSCEQIARVCGVGVDDVERELYTSGLQWEFERGALSGAELASEINNRLGSNASEEALAFASADMFSVIEPMVSIVPALKRLGLPLILLSNTGPWHFEFIRREFSILDSFDAFALSYEAKSLKPDRAVYQSAIDAAGVPAEDCFFVDDLPANVAAAREVGLDAEVFTTPEAYLNDLRNRGISVRL